MRIGELAKRTGVSSQTVRFYERRGLLGDPRRKASGYREFDLAAVRQVGFIRRAQSIGFTLAEIGDLLSMWADSATTCAAVEQRAGATLERIEKKIADLRQMREALTKYVCACRSRSVLDACPLLEELGDPGNVAE